nr:hypothetical protein [Herbidospora cretacea]
MTRIALAAGLFLLAPLMGEYLIGNVPASALPGLIVLAPMYGGAALLIREVTRRTGRGWPTMITLALAYGVLQPAIIDQSLFNPSFDGHDFTAAPTYLPALGLDPGLILTFTTGHAITSLALPIALTEALARHRATTPWLRAPGLTVTTLLFAAGSWLIHADHQTYFQATPLQLGLSAVVVALLLVAAFSFRPTGPRPSAPSRPAHRFGPTRRLRATGRETTGHPQHHPGPGRPVHHHGGAREGRSTRVPVAAEVVGEAQDPRRLVEEGGAGAAARITGREVAGPAAPHPAKAAGERPAPTAPAAPAAPRPWQAGLAAALAVTAHTLRPETWPGLAVGVLLLAAATLVIARWATRPGWTRRHTTCLAAGAALTPLWTGFLLLDLTGRATPPHLIGQAAIAATVAAVRASATPAATSRYAATPPTTPPPPSPPDTPHA